MTGPRGTSRPSVERDRDDDRLDSVLRKPEIRRTLGSSVTARLRELIVTGQLPPGMPLRLGALATRLGISPMPVREALRALESEGLVDFAPHRGATVARLSIEDVEELYAVRAALESLAARVAVSRITDREIATVRREFDRLAQEQDEERFIARDRAFHRRLYDAAARPRLASRIQDLIDSGQRARPLVYRRWRPLSVAVEAHRPIMVAVEARDADAAGGLTRQHLEEAAARVIAALRGSDDETAEPAEGRARSAPRP